MPVKTASIWTAKDAQEFATAAGEQALAAAMHTLRADFAGARPYVKNMAAGIRGVGQAVPVDMGCLTTDVLGDAVPTFVDEPQAQQLTAALMGVAEFLFGCANALGANNLSLASKIFRIVFARHLHALTLLEAQEA